MDFAAEFSSSLPRRRQRVLCADDFGQMADLMRVILERAGHEVVCVANGREAWERVRANPAFFDVVVTDHQMPEMNGLELVQRLRAIRFSGKIIIESSALQPAEGTRPTSPSRRRHLHKPSGLFNLVALI